MSRTNDSAWKKSMRCNNGHCVQVQYRRDTIAVRDSKNPEGGTLTFTHDEWDAFTRDVKSAR